MPKGMMVELTERDLQDLYTAVSSRVYRMKQEVEAGESLGLAVGRLERLRDRMRSLCDEAAAIATGDPEAYAAWEAKQRRQDAGHMMPRQWQTPAPTERDLDRADIAAERQAWRDEQEREARSQERGQ